MLEADIGVEVELERHDLSLDRRRSTGNECVTEAAAAMRSARYGLKAATSTPEGADDVGSPNPLLREAVDGEVIVRTGRRIPGGRRAAGGRAPPDLRRADGGRDAYAFRAAERSG